MMSPSNQSLETVAQHFIHPEGIVSTEWPTVSKIAQACGINFDWWQDQLGMYMLGKRKDGRG